MSNTNSTAPKPEKLHQQPFDRLLRLPEVLHILPIGKSTWWAWIATGKAPRGIKLGAKTTAWRSSDIQKFLDDLNKEGA